jgi:rod shape-determining protein MreD
MNWATTISVLLTAYGLVFLEAWTTLFRTLFGAQPELVASLMVYVAMRLNVTTVALTAVVGGFGLDSLSLNPFGTSVLPLAAAGLALHALRATIVQEDRHIQFLLGLAASGVVPLGQLLLVVTAGAEPLLGPWFAWRWLVLALVGGLCTPLWFQLFARLDRALNYQPEPSATFRPDREIERGRDPHADN